MSGKVRNVKECGVCGSKVKVIECSHCGEDIDALNDEYRQAVPGEGDLCMPCHGIWKEKRDQ